MAFLLFSFTGSKTRTAAAPLSALTSRSRARMSDCAAPHCYPQVMTSGRLAPHEEFDRILRAFERLIDSGNYEAWNGSAYRFATAKWSGAEDFANGKGSLRYGARWIGPGIAAALNLSTTPETAMAESLARSRAAGIPDWSCMPRVVRGVSVRVSRLIDLRVGAIRTALRVSKARMHQTRWERDNRAGKEALTQTLGRAAHAAGIEALLVPSVRVTGGTNVFVFPDDLHPDSMVHIL